MFDDLDRLRDNEVLSALLEHYAGFAEREAWQDRLMQLDGADRNHLVRLHGELLAFGWIEQNTGGARSTADGEVHSATGPPRQVHGPCGNCVRSARPPALDLDLNSPDATLLPSKHPGCTSNP